MTPKKKIRSASRVQRAHLQSAPRIHNVPSAPSYPSDPNYSFKILQPQQPTIHYLVIRPPSGAREHVRRWLSNIHIR